MKEEVEEEDGEELEEHGWLLLDSALYFIVLVLDNFFFFNLVEEHGFLFFSALYFCFVLDIILAC